MPPKANPRMPYTCRHCGSFYSMVVQRLDKIQSGIASCHVCLKTMKLWTGTQVFTFELIRQAEPDDGPHR